MRAQKPGRPAVELSRFFEVEVQRFGGRSLGLHHHAGPEVEIVTEIGPGFPDGRRVLGVRAQMLAEQRKKRCLCAS